MGNRYIEVFPSNVEDLRRAQDLSHYYHEGGSRRSYSSYDAPAAPDPYYSRSYMPPVPQPASSYSHSSSSSYGGEEATIRMLGLPFNATDNDINKWFGEAGVVPLRINRKSAGEAYVDFPNQQEADRAMSRNKVSRLVFSLTPALNWYHKYVSWRLIS